LGSTEAKSNSDNIAGGGEIMKNILFHLQKLTGQNSQQNFMISKPNWQ